MFSFAVIGVVEAYALVVGAVCEPAGEGVHIVVEILPVVPVAVGLGGKRPRAGVVGVADEVPAAYVHRRLKVCRAVDEAVGRSLAAGVGTNRCPRVLIREHSIAVCFMSISLLISTIVLRILQRVHKLKRPSIPLGKTITRRQRN